MNILIPFINDLAPRVTGCIVLVSFYHIMRHTSKWKANCWFNTLITLIWDFKICFNLYKWNPKFPYLFLISWYTGPLANMVSEGTVNCLLIICPLRNHWLGCQSKVPSFSFCGFWVLRYQTTLIQKSREMFL